MILHALLASTISGVLLNDLQVYNPFMIKVWFFKKIKTDVWLKPHL